MKIKNVFFVLSFCLSFAWWAQGAQRTAAEAREMVEGWLALSGNSPLHVQLSGDITAEEAIAQADGTVVGYVFYLSPQGFVVTSADDTVEPVVAFAKKGGNVLDPEGPLATILTQDLPARLAFAQDRRGMLPGISPETAKWARFRDRAVEQRGGTLQPKMTQLKNDPADLRVAPFVQSKWDQGNAGSGRCYNYYTPNNYPCGCTATSWAQMMRYYQYPTAGIGVIARTIAVNGLSQSASTRGGNGAGGAYQWGLMPFEPAGSSEGERQAIGALTYDIGVAISGVPNGLTTSYSSGGTSAYMPPHILRDVFGYASAFRFGGTVNRENAINANLDARMPVNLAISGPGGGHAVVCDGYGFQGGTAYHHLNLGWGGYEDAWYTIDSVDTIPYLFNTLTYVYANVSPGTTGEIISGRVLDNNGQPIANADVTLTPGNLTTQSDASGVYAFAGCPPNTAHTLVAQKGGYSFVPLAVTTGASVDLSTTCGNRWGNTLTGVMSGSYVLASGSVKTGDGTPLAGVTLAFAPGGSTTSTDAGGNFTQALPAGWSGTVTPVLANGYSDPAHYTLNNLTAPMSGLDFTVVRIAYVNAAASGNGSGASWQNAYTSLASALAGTSASIEIWVAKGTYTPPEGNRQNAFYFSPGQKVFGGFNGTETRREQRNWRASPTILSGDIGTKGLVADNCYNVIRGAAGAMVDGCVITGGYADIQINSGTYDQLAQGRGAAVFIWDTPSSDGNSFVVNHCVISNHYAVAQGGALFRCIVRNSIVTGNQGIFAAGSGSIFENCTLTGNTPGAWPVLSGTARNCIIYSNPPVNGSSYYSAALTAQFCCHDVTIAGGAALGSTSANNITVNPLLVTTLPAVPYIIAANSPCRNAGTTLPWMNGATDFFGDPRVSGAGPDIGAYEIQTVHPVFAAAAPAGVPLLGPSGFAVSFNTRYGWRYTLKTSTNLTHWTSVPFATDISGDGSLKTVIDPNTSIPSKFYRVVADPL